MIPSRVVPLCTDEDIATRFRGDFEILCAREYLAAAKDGAIPAGSPWTLASTSTRFASQGVAPGCVVVLDTPSASFGAAGMLFAVDVAADSGLSLRRLNMAPGVGLAPGPPAGLAGIGFKVPTMAAQIENASFDIELQFGVSAYATGRLSSDLVNPREVRAACVLTVVADRYFDLARQAEKGSDLYYAKAAMVKQQLTDLIDRVSVHWKPGPVLPEESSVFGMRIER